MRRSLTTQWMLSTFLGAAACASTTQQAPGAGMAGASKGQDAPTQTAAATPGPPGAGAPLPRPNGPIYFDYDSASLSAAGQAELQALAAWMQRNPRATVRIVGHSDERGTSEYNLSLGDQRARIARDHLVRLGVPADRVDLVSRGEESPADPGATEEAWRKNRRDELEFSMPLATAP